MQTSKTLPCDAALNFHGLLLHSNRQAVGPDPLTAVTLLLLAVSPPTVGWQLLRGSHTVELKGGCAGRYMSRLILAPQLLAQTDILHRDVRHTFLRALTPLASEESPSNVPGVPVEIPSTLPVNLEGTQWTLFLDVGVEPGTWMPPRWGLSGARATPKVRVEFEPEGKLKILETGWYDGKVVEWDAAGEWVVDAKSNVVQFWLPHKGLKRDDVVLEAGKIWFAARAWGAKLGRRGNLTIKKNRFGWLPLPTFPGREASFMVGTFESKQVMDGDPPLGA